MPKARASLHHAFSESTITIWLESAICSALANGFLWFHIAGERFCVEHPMAAPVSYCAAADRTMFSAGSRAFNRLEEHGWVRPPKLASSGRVRKAWNQAASHWLSTITSSSAHST